MTSFAMEIDNRIRQFVRYVDYLQCRWEDEKEYEDFADYITAMQTKVPDGFNFVRATRRPFGCVVSTPFGTKVHVFVSGSKCGWKSVLN